MALKVFKFGGASVSTAAGVRNVADIIQRYKAHELVVVVSAMGKMTNALEHVVQAFVAKDAFLSDTIKVVKEFHVNLCKDLFEDTNAQVYNDIEEWIQYLEHYFSTSKDKNYHRIYDQIVAAGELLSTKIVFQYLKQSGAAISWLDACDLIFTDNQYREGKVDWDRTKSSIQRVFKKNTSPINITQGFIGQSEEGNIVTLGREGSDYTAAILAWSLDAESVTIWKDVPGVLNADPRYFNNPVKLQKISYKEAIELTYYGATVIHPKTMQPLQNKKIELHVRSFVNPDEKGTVIGEDTTMDAIMPSYIYKTNQLLISISPRDFSFIVEENLSHIFQIFAKHGVKINTMQNSALSFSVSVNEDENRFPGLLEELQVSYKVLYNKGLQLLTVRHYDLPAVESVVKGRKILLEQRTRHTLRMLLE